MKKGRPLHEVQQEYRDAVKGFCLSCQKPQKAYWAHYGNEGVCSSKCAKAHEATITLKNADLRVFKRV